MTQFQRQEVLEAVAAFFSEPPGRLRFETAVSSLTGETGDWSDLGVKLEERFGLDMDMEGWRNLGGDPGQGRPISSSATIEAVYAFLQTQPELTIERRVKKVIAAARHFSDPDEVPDCYRFECTAAQWLALRTDLNQSLRPLGVTLDNESWKELGRRVAPVVEQIVAFVDAACESVVA